MSYDIYKWVKTNPEEASAHLLTLERENAALRADKERLDSGRVRLMTRAGDGAWELCDFVDVDLRAAIDAARKEQP